MDTIDTKTPLEKYLVQKATYTKTPIKASFELTPFCNLNCKMCYIRMNTKELSNTGSLLPLEKWLEIAEDLKKIGCLFILLTGGEPLTHPDFTNLYEQLIKDGFIVTINTNGTLINDKYIELFRRYPPRRINITLYGASNNTYRKLCKSSNGFEKTISTLKLLKSNNIPVKINTTIVKDNHNDYYLIKDIANNMNLPLEITSYIFPFIRKGKEVSDYKDLRLSPEDAAYIDLQTKINKDHTTELEYFNAARERFKNSPILGCSQTLDCRAGKSSCWINWQGFLTPCVFMEKPSIDLRENNFEKAWEYIVKESDNLCAFDDCIGCKNKRFCSICYAAAIHEKKATGTLNYLCKMAQEKLRLITSI